MSQQEISTRVYVRAGCPHGQCVHVLDEHLGFVRSKWRDLQAKEREFFGTDYRPGNYVFTFEDGRPPHPALSVKGSTAWRRPPASNA